METTTTPQTTRKGRVPNDPNCPKNAAQRAKYHRRMARLRENPEAYREHLDRKADYQRAYRQTEGGYEVARAAEARWSAGHPEYGRKYYQSTIKPQVIQRINGIVNRFDDLPDERRLAFVWKLCEDDYITLFAMKWATVRDRIVPYLVQLGEEEE